MTPFSSVAMLEKFPLLKIALCSAPVLSRAASRRASVTTLDALGLQLAHRCRRNWNPTLRPDIPLSVCGPGERRGGGGAYWESGAGYAFWRSQSREGAPERK